MATIYEEIEALKTRMDAVESDVSDLSDLTTDLTDSGWRTLPLADGIEAYGGSIPQYRKIGKIVSIRGAVKNVLATGPLATLPEGYRPAFSVPYVQNTSMRSSTCAMFARLIVGVDGVIQVQAISDGAAYAADKWFPIHCTFLID